MGKRWEKPEMVLVYVPSLCTQKLSKLIFVSVFLLLILCNIYL